MRDMLCIVLCFAVLFAGCAGRDPKPISVYQPGDENLHCEALKTQVVQLQQDMAALLPKTDKLGSNTLWAGTGFFTLGIGFFFMDLKDTEKVEFEAMRQRHNKLLEYIRIKQCDVNDIKAEPIPSLDAQKKQAEEMLKQQKTAGKQTQSQTTTQTPAK
jgi:PBP1b-binding outer membrane lipoprotein LpoB